MPITSKSSKFKGETQNHVEKVPKSATVRHYCSKIHRVPGTLGIRTNSSPVGIISLLTGNGWDSFCSLDYVIGLCTLDRSSQSGALSMHTRDTRARLRYTITEICFIVMNYFCLKNELFLPQKSMKEPI